MRSLFKLSVSLFSLFMLLCACFTASASDCQKSENQGKYPPGNQQQYTIDKEEAVEFVLNAPMFESRTEPVIISARDVAPFTINNYSLHYVVWSPGGTSYNYIYVLKAELIQEKHPQLVKVHEIYNKPHVKPGDSYYAAHKRSRR